MNKTLASIVLGLGILTPISLDASIIVPCIINVKTIKEYPATPLNPINPRDYQTDYLSLNQKYQFGARYSVVDERYEESVCSSLLPRGITIVRFAE